MNLKEERKIIFRAVRESIVTGDRHETARAASLKANKKGINVVSAPYIHDIFCEALDKKEREGFF